MIEVSVEQKLDVQCSSCRGPAKMIISVLPYPQFRQVMEFCPTCVDDLLQQIKKIMSEGQR